MDAGYCSISQEADVKKHTNQNDGVATSSLQLTQNSHLNLMLNKDFFNVGVQLGRVAVLTFSFYSLNSILYIRGHFLPVIQSSLSGLIAMPFNTSAEYNLSVYNSDKS